MLDLKAIVKNATLPVDQEIVELAKGLASVSDRTIREGGIYLLGQALEEKLPVIDLEKALRSGGVDPKMQLPKLAIAHANANNVFCRVLTDGSINFSGIVTIQDMMPTSFIREWFGSPIEAEAPVPMIPLEIRPKNLSRYDILWEPLWKRIVRPIDPYLITHVTGVFFQIIATWNVTEAEVRAMRMARVV